MTALNIVPECYVDTKLAEILSENKIKIYHQKGHGNVANKMQFGLKDQFALGIIDEDTIKVRKAKYFTAFKVIKIENALILQKHNKLNHYLIIIKPAIEKWLLANAKESEVVPNNLGNQLEDLMNFTKKKNIHKNPDFYIFIKELIRKKSPGIITFKLWIEKFLARQDIN
ncbi:MAG: hypothetical protein ABI405_12195 [Parafilimonas sp.]